MFAAHFTLSAIRPRDTGSILLLMGEVARTFFVLRVKCRPFGKTDHSKRKKPPEPMVQEAFLEQGTGIEPASSAWEADVLPMY